MRKPLFLSILLGSLLISLTTVCAPQKLHAAPANNCPIILVNAWACWARGQGLGFNIFGGQECDIQDELKAAGYQTFTPSMGPFSSTWDRGCELYAQIRGGTVDYGLAHSRKYGHARYGRTYPAMYPEWGSMDPLTGKPRKVHFIALCYGGLTSRLLVQLLEKGSAEERAATAVSELSPLFAGNHSWVLSCTTLVTPHDGTSLLDQDALDVLSGSSTLQLLVDMFAPYLPDDFYDMQLDQWGIYQNPNESLHAFVKRLASSPAWKNKKDFSNYDILPWGIYNFNSWVKAQPDVYYFSLAADATYKDNDGHCHPFTSMLPLFYAFSEYMGGHVRYSLPFFVNSKWWPNDGTVNVISQNGPKIGAGTHDAIVNFTGTPQVGKWNFLGTLKGVDHTDVVGITFGWFPTYRCLPWFLNHATLLSSLPQ